MRTQVRWELDRAQPMLWQYQLTLGLWQRCLMLWRLSEMKLGECKLLQYLHMVRLSLRPWHRPQ